MVFVVHRHEARRLHYDLRIAMQGVLKSWAVPKGFSYDPGDKRLAVRTEDHPLLYFDFEGVIPKGEYGAGTMTIWDRGRYELLRGVEGVEQLEEGKIELRLFGSRLRGEWHMVKLKKHSQDWLLFKSRDRYARDKNSPQFPLDLTRIPRQPVPRRLRRMEPGRSAAPFHEPGWLYELKLDGWRVFAERSAAGVRFRGARKNLARRVTRVVDGLLELKAERAVVDGILVCLDEAQRPSRRLLDETLAGRADGRIDFYIFDLLYYEDWDLRSIPLIERKAALASILPKTDALVLVEHERSKARELFATVAAMQLGGCIAKQAESTYTGGSSTQWVEINTAQASERTPQAVKSSQTEPARHAVRFTNRDKVLWPRDGYTKGDLIDYYDRAADYVLPYLQDRPLSLHRFPNGVEQPSFYQKQTAEHYPQWIRTARIESHSRDGKQVEFVVCDTRQTLLYLANLACVELHPWSSCCESLEEPTWAILDLDPPGDDFAKVVQVARFLGKLLRGLRLRPCLKTSGAKGLHIYLPLQTGYTYDQVRMFCEGVARYAAHELREIATVERVKSQRQGKVYLDFLQNRRGQTIVAPYSVRPVRGAQVSTPLDWDELSAQAHPSRFTIETVLPRLTAKGDLFQPALLDRQDLLPAIAAFQELVGGRGSNAANALRKDP